jgi:RNA-directed DNA polymerase
MVRISTREQPRAIASICSRKTRLVTVLCRFYFSPAQYRMTSIHVLASALASTWINTPWAVVPLIDSAATLLGKRRPWIRPLVERILAQCSLRPRHQNLTRIIERDQEFNKAFYKYKLHIQRWPIQQSAFDPLPFATDLKLPKLTTVDELADWLGVGLGHLEWYADCRGWSAKTDNPRLTHYHYRTLSKRFGAVRLIEAPKPRIKSLQRLILDGILSHVPTHPAAQGFRRGTSIRTFAAPHVNRRVVLKLDLSDFFPSISCAQVNAVFRALGYPESIAKLLAGICTNAVPADTWKELYQPYDSPAQRELILQSVRKYSRRHLPQGAPTSPALSNLCAYRLDCRLAAVASSAGAIYTRYADDLAFSGSDAFRRSAQRFYHLASAIVMDEGFQVNFRKTRIMPRGVKQQLAGLVLNSHLNTPRRDFDELKAILTNCLRSSPESQNRVGHRDFRQHLLGRISFVTMIAPGRGQKLRAIFDRIQW